MIKIGIVGYGNLGKGIERACQVFEDMEVVGIFTRRDPGLLKADSPVYSMDELDSFKEKIDICILAGGSATDLVEQGPLVLKNFNTVDCFDTHAKIPEYFDKMNRIGKENNTLSLISTGWDPGLFSINRLFSECILPQGDTYTFWGRGVSQGHSDAVRRIEGVKNAIQYTIPNKEVIEKIKAGEKLELSTRDKHFRECFVVLEEGADAAAIKDKIINMPNYFSDYDTTVHFISEEELFKDHKGMPHGGTVIRIGETSEGARQNYEFTLSLESNPEFTASVAVAYGRGVFRASEEGKTGAITVFDIPLSYLSNYSGEELRKNFL